MTTTRVILVKKQSAWAQYHANGSDFGKLTMSSRVRMEGSHERHSTNVQLVEAALKELRIKPWVVDGAGLNFTARKGDLVITVGGDGTVLSSSHHVGPDAALMAINSDPIYSVGRFCTVFPRKHLILHAIEKALSPKRKVTMIPRMTIRLDGKIVHQRVLNEVLFSHTCPAAMTRVAPPGKIRYACSGLWVGTAAGSTGAIRSAGGKVLPITAKQLQTIVREPFDPASEHEVKGPLVSQAESFKFTSLTSDATLFIDGAFFRIPVGFEQRMQFELSDEPLPLVGSIPR